MPEPKIVPINNSKELQLVGDDLFPGISQGNKKKLEINILNIFFGNTNLTTITKL